MCTGNDMELEMEPEVFGDVLGLGFSCGLLAANEGMEKNFESTTGVTVGIHFSIPYCQPASCWEVLGFEHRVWRV